MTTWRVPQTVVPPAPAVVHLWRAALDRDDEQVASRGLLRCVLARYLAIEPEAVQLHRAAYGKPYLAGGSRRPALRFNLSHSGGIALIAVAGGREVGVDVESLGRTLDYERIIARFLSPREQLMLGTLPPSLRRHAFLTCWVRKEAYAKATGLGLSLPFAQFTVSVHPEEPAAVLAVDAALSDASRWSLRDVPVGGGYVAALAAKGQGWIVRQLSWPPSSYRKGEAAAFP